MDKTKKIYVKPAFRKVQNLRDITFECPAWQCSVVVPPAPTA